MFDISVFNGENHNKIIINKSQRTPDKGSEKENSMHI